ncbi:MAG: hypothetical protein KAV25_09135 [Methanophagales archaeon]|nr:hypothetical protein [Methanophagales archaeon]
MKITETDLAWRCIFFPDAIDTNVKDEKEKGYIVQFGEVGGEAVPKFIDYLKDKFSLESAIQYAKNIKECGICKTLNSQVDVVESVTVKDQYERPKADIAEAVSALKEEVVGLKKKLEGPPERRNAAKDLYQKIAADMFKSQFTPAGLIELSLIFDDESFIEDLLPDQPSEEDMLSLRAEMASFWAGDEGRYKTPDQMRQYAKNQRDMVKTLRGEPIEEEEEKPKARRLKGKRVKIVA